MATYRLIRPPCVCSSDHQNRIHDLTSNISFSKTTFAPLNALRVYILIRAPPIDPGKINLGVAAHAYAHNYILRILNMATGGCGEDGAQSQSSSRPRRAEERHHREGYTCEFVERPPKAFQCDCPICLLVLREPHQITCCGYSFCQACVKRVQADNKCCPTCNAIDYAVFPDKRLKRSLNDFRVYCSNKEEGCEWAGELGELDRHLNLQPPSEKRFVGCLFSEVDCSFCSHPFQRRYVQTHQSEDCPSRPYTCQHCNEYSADFEDVTTKHWPLCAFFPLSCPNSCEMVLQRRELENHVEKDCLLTPIDCDFSLVGCKARLARNDMPSHVSRDLSAHMSLLQMYVATHPGDTVILMPLLVGSMQKLVIDNESLRNENFVLKKSMSELKERSCAHQHSLERLTYTGTLPVTITMPDFAQHKLDDDVWFSPPFYTHTHGYKMCLKVFANGYSNTKGKCVSVFSFLMQGEYDDELEWPYSGTIDIHLVNQLQDQNHHKASLSFEYSDDFIGLKRVTGLHRAERACGGRHEFIAHTALDLSHEQNTQYLKDNELHFAITKCSIYSYSAATGKKVSKKVSVIESIVEVIEPTICIVPIEFTLREFEHLKSTNDRWFSPSLYSNSKGYRFCFSVDSNGYGNSKGTHVSIYTHIMRGQFDDSLQWPFRGAITIQLLNQIEDKNHVEEISDSEAVDSDCSKRVTSSTSTRSTGFGFPEFIPHNLLGYNAAKNTQYLQNDTLRIRILKITNIL